MLIENSAQVFANVGWCTIDDCQTQKTCKTNQRQINSIRIWLFSINLKFINHSVQLRLGCVRSDRSDLHSKTIRLLVLATPLRTLWIWPSCLRTPRYLRSSSRMMEAHPLDSCLWKNRNFDLRIFKTKIKANILLTFYRRRPTDTACCLRPHDSWQHTCTCQCLQGCSFGCAKCCYHHRVWLRICRYSGSASNWMSKQAQDMAHHERAPAI